MNKIAISIIGTFIISLFFFSSCGDEPVNDSTGFNDSIAGIFGQIMLYDEYGVEITDKSGITVEAYWEDQFAISSDTSTSQVPHGTIYTTTSSSGWYEFKNTKTGVYNLTFSAQGFGINTIHAYDFDSTQADTMEIVKLAKTPPGFVYLNSISCDSTKTIYNITRTISFTGSSAIEYGLTSRYFFDTTEAVSDKNYIFTTVSGTSVNFGGEQDILTVKIAARNILNSKIEEGRILYMKAYVDNYYPIAAKIHKDTIVYPNITGESNVLRFVLDSIPN